MECNKEEALRAKELAEKKFANNDIAGAKKLAVKAQNLYPGLDGVSQFLSTLNLYISAEKTTKGDVDYYKVLGVEPSADDDTIRKNYRRLALILHPDKNKSVGADGAFKILSEGLSVLSDKVKRFDYDLRNARDFSQKFPNGNLASHMQTSQNGNHSVFNKNNSDARTWKSSTHSKPAPPSRSSRSNTFWTICIHCTTHFEYLKAYTNHKLLCPTCRQPFLAVEVPPPPINGSGSSTSRSSSTKGQDSSHHTRTEKSHAAEKKPAFATNKQPAFQSRKPVFQSGSFSRMGSFGSAPSAVNMEPVFPSGSFSKMRSFGSTTSAASSILRGEKLKRKHEEALPPSDREESVPGKLQTSKRTGSSLGTGSSNTSSGSGSVPEGNRQKKKRHIDEVWINSNGRVEESGPQKSNSETGSWNFAGDNKPYGMRELPQLEIQKMLIEKAKKDVHEKLKEWSNMPAVSKTSEREMVKEKGKQIDVAIVMKVDSNRGPENLDAKTSAHATESSPTNSDDDPEREAADPLSMSVPDPDFHDFDMDRTEKSFGDNQVWAAYDDDDGMPRYYAVINKVMSRKPFRMQISWLNSKSNRELGPINWIASGFYKTMGEFWIGKRELYASLNSFSHKVKWKKGTRGVIQIYPRKGDVWAIYRNWSADWNELTSDEVIHKYDMVEVVEDYNEEGGVIVAPLVKVPGFKTVFCRHSDPGKTMTILREELFRLSHQVPSYLLTGHEVHHVPNGCRELDPASLPLELLQVLTEAQLTEMGTAKKEEKNDPPSDSQKSEEVKLTENGMEADDAEKDDAETRKNKVEEKKMLVYQRRHKNARGFGMVLF